MARKGLPKSYIKKWGITKKAWREYHAAQARKAKHIGYSKSRTTKSKTKPKKRRVRRTGRRKKRRGGKSLQTTVFKWLRVISIFAPEAYHALVEKKPAGRVFADMIYDKTGYNMADGTFKLERLAKGWGPFVMTCLATYGIPKLVGIIRRI